MAAADHPLDRSTLLLDHRVGDAHAGDMSHVPPWLEHEHLMPLRLQLLGLDPDYIEVCHAEDYELFAARCAKCDSVGTCTRDLADGNVEAGQTDYCPNAALMDALVVASE